MLRVLVIGGGILLALAFWIYCLLDAVTTDATAYRRLPKPIWVLIALVPVIGSLAWFVVGRPQTATEQAAGPQPRRVSNPDDDEEFLRQIRKRAEEQRRRAKEQGENREE